MPVDVNVHVPIDPDLQRRIAECVGGRSFVLMVEHAEDGPIKLEGFTNGQNPHHVLGMLARYTGAVLQMLPTEQLALRWVHDFGAHIGRAVIAKWPRP